MKQCYLYEEEVQMVIGFPSNFYYLNHVIGLILNILLAILTVFLNSITILAYRKSAQLKSKKSYFLIMLLSVSDLLVGLVGNSSYILVLITIIINYPRCPIYYVYEFATFCTSGMSIITLFGLNIERYLSILHPFFHRTKVTKSKILKVILASWLFVITLRLSYWVFGRTLSLIASTMTVVMTCSTLYVYAAIYIRVRGRPRVTETRELRERKTETRVIRGRINQIKNLQNTKMAKSCGIVVLFTYICYIPLAIVYSLPRSNIVSLLTIWSLTLGFAASSLNSLIFFWNNTTLRLEAKKLFQNII